MRKSLLFLFAAPLLWACSSERVAVGVSARVGTATTSANHLLSASVGQQLGSMRPPARPLSPGLVGARRQCPKQVPGVPQARRAQPA